MELLALISVALALASLATITVAILYKKEIIKWFQERVEQLKIEPYISGKVGPAEIKAGATIAFTLYPEEKERIEKEIAEKLKDGTYKVVSGVFEKETLKKKEQERVIQGFYDLEKQEITDGRVIIADEVDQELKDMHKDNVLVIYE